MAQASLMSRKALASLAEDRRVIDALAFQCSSATFTGIEDVTMSATQVLAVAIT